MYGTLDISVSGLIAQRTRMESIAANIANVHTRHNVNGENVPYRRREVHFAPGDPTAQTELGQTGGVHVAAITLDDAPFNKRWDPTHPDAIKEGADAGYVLDSNVNVAFEQVNAVEAARAYEANVVAAEATKAMISQALRMIA